MKTDLVKIVFEKYLDQIYPDAKPAGAKLNRAQYKEVKNAFYAAWFAALNETMQMAEHLTEEQALAALKTMIRECEDHGKDVLNKFYQSN